MGFWQNAWDRLRDAMAASKNAWNKRAGILLVVAISVTVLAVVLRSRPSKASRAPAAPVAVASVPKAASEAPASVPTPQPVPPVREPTPAPAAVEPVAAPSVPPPVAVSPDMAELRDAVADLRAAQANARDAARETSAEWSAFCEVQRDLVRSLTRMAAQMEETLRGFTGSTEEHEKLLAAQRVLGESLAKAVVQLERAASERTTAADKQEAASKAGFAEVVLELRKLRVALTPSSSVAPAPAPQARAPVAPGPTPQRSPEAAKQKLVQWKGGWVTEDEREQYEAQLLPILARFASQRSDLKDELLRGGFSSRQEYDVARMNLREAARTELLEAGFASEQVREILKEEFK